MRNPTDFTYNDKEISFDEIRAMNNEQSKQWLENLTETAYENGQNNMQEALNGY